MSVSGHLHFAKDDDERANLRLHPIVDPTIGHMAMLPLGAEGALINFDAGHGDRGIQAFVVTEQFIEYQKGLIEEHGADTTIGVTALLYILPEGWSGPLP